MKVIVIGGGPAGMMAAYIASQHHEVHLYEKNQSLGKKLLMTGHGRCNITNKNENIMNHMNSRFLYSGFSQFSNNDFIEFIESHGLKLVEEDQGRMFPMSQSSKDVLDIFLSLLKNVHIHYNSPVSSLWVEDEVKGIICENKKIQADKVIIATGGMSYPSTGSTGDGYLFAKQIGHHLIPVSPGLTGVNASIKGITMSSLQGLTLECDYTIHKKRYHGSLLFTHYGLSGPDIINKSKYLNKDDSIHIHLPIELSGKKTIKNQLLRQYPHRLVDVIMRVYSIDEQAVVNEKYQRILSNCTLEVKVLSKRSFKEAMITIGGISTKEIDPKTMQSCLDPHVYFAGEVMDLDGETGGYNLQIAWTTGKIAGE